MLIFHNLTFPYMFEVVPGSHDSWTLAQARGTAEKDQLNITKPKKNINIRKTPEGHCKKWHVLEPGAMELRGSLRVNHHQNDEM